jgi:hypothetical protein
MQINPDGTKTMEVGGKKMIYQWNDDLNIRCFHQTGGISMSTNCVPILASLFKYSYEADFIEGILRENGKRLIKSFNLAYRLYRWCPFQAYGEFRFSLVLVFSVIFCRSLLVIFLFGHCIVCTFGIFKPFLI